MLVKSSRSKRVNRSSRCPGAASPQIFKVLQGEKGSTGNQGGKLSPQGWRVEARTSGVQGRKFSKRFSKVNKKHKVNKVYPVQVLKVIQVLRPRVLKVARFKSQDVGKEATKGEQGGKVQVLKVLRAKVLSPINRC